MKNITIYGLQNTSPRAYIYKPGTESPSLT